MKKVLIASFFLLFLKTASLGQFIFTNKSEKDIMVAIKYCANPRTNHWIACGWYQIASGRSFQVLNNPLRNRYIYFYAESDDREYIWEGTNETCGDRNQFQYDAYPTGGGYSTNLCPFIFNFKLVDVATRHNLNIH